jgi:hypothetical protein
MIEAFFTWISQMTRLEAFSYIILIAFIMLVIPYATFLYKAIQKIVLWKKMKVINFGYSFYPNLIKSITDLDNVLLPENNFVLEGSPIILYWKVEGAIQVRLLPGIGKVKGDAAEVLVSRNRRHFTLEVKGIFSKQNLQIEIPLDKIKSLESAYISEFQVHTQVENVKCYPITQSTLLKNSLIRNFPAVSRYFMGNLNTTRKLINHRPNNNLIYKANIDHIIFNQKITKSYSFSTQKYNSHNQFKPLNS